MSTEPDERLRAYATDKQWGYYESYCKCGTYLAVEQELGVDKAVVHRAVQALKRKAAQHGWSPEHGLTHEAAPGFVVKGTSTLYDETGGLRGQWSKTKIEGRDAAETIQLPDPKKIVKRSTLYDQEGNVAQQWIAEKPSDEARENLWREWAAGVVDPLPRFDPIESPVRVAADNLAAYWVGDHHNGMYAWAEETGANWNLSLSERLLSSASAHLMNALPPCEEALIGFMGDYFHYDSFAAVTPTSHNLLDADGRFPKMLRVGARAARAMIDLARERHGRVRVIVVPGNHDLASSAFFRLLLEHVYEHEPRVTIDTKPGQFHYYRFGKVLLGTNHGHRVKMRDMPLIMAHDCPTDWGASKHRYVWTAHLHRDDVVDVGGVRVERVRVLPPPDAWAHQEGYRSKREMKAVVYHKDHGETARFTVNPGMF